MTPIVKRILVPGRPGAVFELFTARIDEWWPKTSHSVEGEDVEVVRMEPGVGGRVYEATSDGVEHEWGRIGIWEPGSRLGMTWYPGLSPAEGTYVEVTFHPAGDGTEVTLVHDGWAARGENWPQVRDDYDTGWDLVLSLVPGARLANSVEG